MLGLRMWTSSVWISVLCCLAAFPATPAKPNGARKLIKAEEMREWLAYLSSDELEGRNTFSEGLGMAAAYISGQLKSWGVRAGGDNGSYFQRVRVLGVKSTNNSTITVEANGVSRTFKNEQGIRLPRNVGGKRAFTSDQIEFVGYGLNLPDIEHNDYAGRIIRGKVAVWLGAAGPKSVGQHHQRALRGRARYAQDVEGAIASIGVGGGGFGRGQGAPERAEAPPASPPPPTPAGAPPVGAQPGFGGPRIEASDFTTVQRLDAPLPPSVSAENEFFDFLFRGQETDYAALKEKVEKREPLPRFTLKSVRITFNLDAEYRVVRTQYTRNVVGIVEGRDPRLRDTYVSFGAHYDHVGYSEGEVVQTSSGLRRAEPRGRVKENAADDRIWNGADDDGSGTATLLAVAKAFALGPKPRRSVILVWHSGEERGLFGSRYFADYPTVPIEKIVANVNLDMVGRNRDDRAEEANKIYAVGSDRISTELHNVVVDANNSLPRPLDLDYELNDPRDLEQVYYRSDHYSYAAKGIPIVFFTTGLHSDYHFNTDSYEKINYEKMERIGQLVYELGMRIGNLEHSPARDHRGPRAGKGSSGKLTQ